MSAALVITASRGGQVCGRHRFRRDVYRRIRIGRTSKADIVIDDPSVSRLHALIQVEQSKAILHELGSLTGLELNGERVHGSEVELYMDDCITIGNTVLQIAWEQDDVDPAVAHERQRLIQQIASMSDSTSAQLEHLLAQVRARRVANDTLYEVPDENNSINQQENHQVQEPPEKYDTRRLVSQMKRESWRMRGALVVAAALLLAALVAAALSTAPKAETAPPRARKTAVAPVASNTVPKERPAPKVRTYTVRSGDTLGSIAARELGDSRQWKAIYNTNKGILADPSELEIGMVLRLPNR